MLHLILSAVCVAATESNATYRALADRVEWSRVNNKASYDWPNSTLRHFAPAEAMDVLRGRQRAAFPKELCDTRIPTHTTSTMPGDYSCWKCY